MTHKTMDNPGNDPLSIPVGFGIGIIVWFLRVPDAWVLGEFLKAIEALCLGGVGAFGAWLVRRHILKHVEAHGSVRAWIKHILNDKKQNNGGVPPKNNEE